MILTPADLQEALPGLFENNPCVQVSGHTVTVRSNSPADTLSYEAALHEATDQPDADRMVVRTVVHNRDTPEEARYLYLAVRVYPVAGTADTSSLSIFLGGPLPDWSKTGTSTFQ